MNKFTKHPESAGENYLEHLQKSWVFSGKIFALSVSCFIHGLFPFLFVHTTCDGIAALEKEMSERKRNAKKRRLNGNCN